jgi:hypothetical protein
MASRKERRAKGTLRSQGRAEQGRQSRERRGRAKAKGKAEGPREPLHCHGFDFAPICDRQGIN